jgi:hypothetical protein
LPFFSFVVVSRFLNRSVVVVEAAEVVVVVEVVVEVVVGGEVDAVGGVAADGAADGAADPEDIYGASAGAD